MAPTLLWHNFPSMRKLLIRVLAAILLLQFSWIAAASGCMHEKDASTQHFGHHVHVHKSAQGKELAKHGANIPDDDCAICHLGCGSVPGSDVTITVTRVHDAAPTAVPLLHASPRPDHPDRPRWDGLA